MASKILEGTPAGDGFYFAAEWEHHDATWLSWPHKEASWPGKIEKIYAPYCAFIKAVAAGEKVRINVGDAGMQEHATTLLREADVPLHNIEFYLHATNDAWCRDHGGAVLINKASRQRAVVNWGYNAWGDKYPPYDLDNKIPGLMADALGLPVYNAPLIMEGGSVEFNGRGTLITTSACLLNKNRNPGYNKQEIEQILKDYYGVNQVLWLGDGIVGDDTDGHVDDITRFVNENTVVTVVEENVNDDNHLPLKENLALLQDMRFPDGSRLNIIPLPMPDPVVYEDTRLPASYANFYISNAAVVVPTFRCGKDEQALAILQDCFPDRKVIGIDSTDIIWGLGSFHCLSQQEPSATIE